MAKSNVQVIQVPAGSDVSLCMQGDYGKQIANAPGGVINIISLDATDKIPLTRLKFDSTHYNLIVVNECIFTNGKICISEEHWLKNSLYVIPDGLTYKKLNEFTMYPAVIVRQNETHRKAIPGSTAALCILFDPTIGSNKKSITFKYIISYVFLADKMNAESYRFGIHSSSQSNELDHLCWEIKNKNIFKILNLEEKLNG